MSPFFEPNAPTWRPTKVCFKNNDPKPLIQTQLNALRALLDRLFPAH